jgi:hypothetical protein
LQRDNVYGADSPNINSAASFRLVVCNEGRLWQPILRSDKLEPLSGITILRVVEVDVVWRCSLVNELRICGIGIRRVIDMSVA